MAKTFKLTTNEYTSKFHESFLDMLSSSDPVKQAAAAAEAQLRRDKKEEIALKNWKPITSGYYLGGKDYKFTYKPPKQTESVFKKPKPKVLNTVPKPEPKKRINVLGGMRKVDYK